MDPIRVGFLGTGDVSPLHAEAVRLCEGAHLEGVWNLTDDMAQRRAQEFGCRVYDTAQDLVTDPKIDAVFVLTNMETHAKYATLAMEAGKHTLIEKPTASSVQEIQSLVETARRTGVQGAPVHNYIYEPALERTKRLIDSGKLGKLVSIYVMYNIHHPEVVAGRYPGVVKHILTHHSYILIYLGGTPTAVTAMKATINDGSVPQENLAMATLTLESGALSHLCASFAADDHAGDPWTCMIKVIGTAGATRFSYRDWVENKPAVVHSQTYSVYPDSITNTVHHFLNRCVRRGEPPLSTLDDAVTCQRIIEACEASIDEGRHIRLS